MGCAPGAPVGDGGMPSDRSGVEQNAVAGGHGRRERVADLSRYRASRIRVAGCPVEITPPHVESFALAHGWRVAGSFRLHVARLAQVVLTLPLRQTPARDSRRADGNSGR